MMDVKQQLREYLFRTLIPTEESRWPADDGDLIEAGMDSLRLMQLLVFVEESLGVRLPDHEVTPERVESLNSLAEWVDSHRN